MTIASTAVGPAPRASPTCSMSSGVAAGVHHSRSAAPSGGGRRGANTIVGARTGWSKNTVPIRHTPGRPSRVDRPAGNRSSMITILCFANPGMWHIASHRSMRRGGRLLLLSTTGVSILPVISQWMDRRHRLARRWACDLATTERASGSSHLCVACEAANGECPKRQRGPALRCNPGAPRGSVSATPLDLREAVPRLLVSRCPIPRTQ